MPLPKKVKLHFVAVLSTESGREVLRQILDWGSIYRQQGLDEANSLFFAEGRRSMALQVQAAMLESSERDAYKVMFESAKAKKKEKVNDEEMDE